MVFSYDTPTLTILGGGPAGLATGYFARKAGVDFQIFEASERVGGNAITHAAGKFRFDSGAHRFHDRHPEITAEIRALLGTDLLECELPSKIYHRGGWVDFPLSPGNLLTTLGWKACAGAAWDLFRAKAAAEPEGDDFESFAIHSYGREIANRFLLPYSEKLWGSPCDRLSRSIAGKRLKGLNLTTFLLEAVGAKMAKTRHLDGGFLYPRLGIGMIAERLAEACGSESLRLNSKITRVFHADNRIQAVEVNGTELAPVDQVVSTLPLPLWLRLMEPAPEHALLELAGTLRFRHVILVGVFINRPRVTNLGTAYFADSEFSMTRVYEPKNRSAEMAPSNQTMLVAEIPCAEEDAVWKLSDDAHIQRVRGCFESVGWLRPDEFLGGCVRHVPFAYPVLERDIEGKVRRLAEGLRFLQNLRFVGRNMQFQYAHLHDMFQFGKQVVAELSGQTAPSVDTPVLSA